MLRIFLIVILTLTTFTANAKKHHHKHHHVYKEVKATKIVSIMNNHLYDAIFRRKNNSRLLKAMCGIESNLKPNAISRAGAKGICQFKPRTWKKVTHQVMRNTPSPTASITAANDLLSSLKEKYHGDTNKALAAYNLGETGLQKRSKRCGGNPNDIPYKQIHKCLPSETKMYVVNVMSVANSITGL
jgi:membrane-bound lytic murein transglycosylase D